MARWPGFAEIVLLAAALGAAYAILVELIIFRDIHPIRDLPRGLGGRDGVKQVGFHMLASGIRGRAARRRRSTRACTRSTTTIPLCCPARARP